MPYSKASGPAEKNARKVAYLVRLCLEANDEEPRSESVRGTLVGVSETKVAISCRLKSSQKVCLTGSFCTRVPGAVQTNSRDVWALALQIRAL